MLPGGSAAHGDQPVCIDCAGITQDYHCSRCGPETEHYRQNTCACCSLRDDLTVLLRVDDARGSGATATKLLGALCGAQRPESILTWLRKMGVRDVLQRLATGEIPLHHEALDQESNNLRVEHMRSLLTHHKLLPNRDHYLALFQRWLTSNIEDVDDAVIRRPVGSFRSAAPPAMHQEPIYRRETHRGPVHSAKQEITETIKFLTWLKLTHGWTVASCVQADVHTWLADGPTTRRAFSATSFRMSMANSFSTKRRLSRAFYFSRSFVRLDASAFFSDPYWFSQRYQGASVAWSSLMTSTIGRPSLSVFWPCRTLANELLGGVCVP